jgi:ribosomal protein S5
VIKATFDGLKNLRDPKEVARLREKPLEDILGLEHDSSKQ